jgi:hypothetical protein
MINEKMSFEIARWKMNGDIILIGTRKKIVYNMIEWKHRITFYKDEVAGKVVFALDGVPPDAIPFVSYPIIGGRKILIKDVLSGKFKTDVGNYTPGRIINDLDTLAEIYGINGSVNFMILPRQSMQIMMSHDIPLTETNVYISEVLGHNDSIKDRLMDEDHRGVKMYKRINLGPMVVNWQYRIGYKMHNSTPKHYDAYTDENGDIIPTKIRGVEETERMKVLADEIMIGKKEVNEIESDIYLLNDVIGNIVAKMDKLQTLYEDAVRNRSDEIDTYTSERQSSKIRHIAELIYEELELTQDQMLVEEVNLMVKVEEAADIEVIIAVLRSNMEKENKKIIDLLDKMMSSSYDT